MKHCWLHRGAGATDLIVIFGGWAIGPQVWSGLQAEADLLLVWDYATLDLDLPDLRQYRSRTLVAWSFGIASYALWQAPRPDPFTRKVAICGSMTPVHSLTGIAPRVVQLTIDTLSDANFQHFVTRCFGAEQPPQPIDIAARRAELEAIRGRDYSGLAQHWDRVWIGTEDRIFPLANMKRAWADAGNALRVIDAPHAPFALWSSFAEVLA